MSKNDEESIQCYNLTKNFKNAVIDEEQKKNRKKELTGTRENLLVENVNMRNATNNLIEKLMKIANGRKDKAGRLFERFVKHL